MAGKRKLIEFIVNERECHICISHCLGTSGYPCIWKDGRNQNMHRVLYEEYHGSLPAGWLVRHTCDDRRCINLEHLIMGTAEDNIVDKTMRNRDNPLIGMRSGTAKLTNVDVKSIKDANLSQYKVAEKYKVNQSTISRIRNGRLWGKVKL